jgi:hypothetical protein
LERNPRDEAGKAFKPLRQRRIALPHGKGVTGQGGIVKFRKVQIKAL